MKRWTCSCCGKQHEGLPNSYGYEKPWYWGDRDQQDSTRGCMLNGDYCTIDGEYFFVRGCIEIPIIGSEEPLLWGVWSSLSKQNFDREVELAESSDRIHEPAYFGWLSTRLEIYPDTLNLKCNVHSRLPGQRPDIKLEPANHPLAIEQSQGISMDRLIEIAEKIEHNWVHPCWKGIGS
jgi:hypothetical protein